MLDFLVLVHALRNMIILILVCSSYVVHARTIGGIVDYSSAHGKEEKVAMEMAIEDCCAIVPLHRCVGLHFMNSGKDPLEAASSGKVSVIFLKITALLLARTQEIATWLLLLYELHPAIRTDPSSISKVACHKQTDV